MTNTTKINLTNIVIVLVEPQSPGNVGSVARAMTNMGFSDLRLVNPKRSHLDDEGRRLAHGSQEMLENAKVFPTLEEAISDCTTLVATSNKPKRYKKNSYSAREIGVHLAPYCINNKIAILFGRENYGLYNDEIKICSWLLHIPTAAEYPAVNLSQAVLLTCYELFMSQLPEPPKNFGQFATQSDLENFYSRVLDIINLAGFQHKNNDTTIFIGALRRIFGRTCLNKHEINIMFKLFSQFEYLVEDTKK